MTYEHAAFHTVDWWERAVGEWAHQTFGMSTTARVLRHLREEVTEIETANEMHIGEEIADAMFLLLRLADMHGISLDEAMEAKLTINRARRWGPADEHGVIRHEESPRLATQE